MIPKRKRTSLSSVLAVAGVALLILLTVFFRHGMTGLLWGALAPVVGARNSLESSDVSQLRAELASSTAALADRDLLAAENAQLRQELGRTGSKRELLAGVLQSPPGTPYDTLMVDAGSNNGVVLGARVSVGALSIGTVDAVYDNSARVALYSAPGVSYQALLLTRDATLPVAVDGQGAGSMQAQVPAGTNVAVGDSITFPGVAGGLAAKVSAVSTPDGESFKTVYMRLPVNPFELRFIYIEK